MFSGEEKARLANVCFAIAYITIWVLGNIMILVPAWRRKRVGLQRISKNNFHTKYPVVTSSDEAEKSMLCISTGSYLPFDQLPS